MILYFGALTIKLAFTFLRIVYQGRLPLKFYKILNPKFTRSIACVSAQKINFYLPRRMTDDLLRVFVLRALPAHEQLFCGGEIYL